MKIGELPPTVARNIRADSSGCWLWTGILNKGGYAKAKYKQRTWIGHRLVYTLLRGFIPEGLTLDHLCRNRACVNPAHLDPCSMRENIFRSSLSAARINAEKTKCIRGHELTLLPSGKRGCLTCMHIKQAEWYQRNREEHLRRTNEHHRRICASN